MNATAVLQLELTSNPRQLPRLRQRVGRWIVAQGWTEPQVGELVLALDEAVTNVIRHAYENRPHQRIMVCAEPIVDPRAGEGLEIRVRDFGRQVDPAQIQGRNLDDVRPGGLGVHIMRAMTNAVEYHPAEGGGMLVIMRKFKSHTAGVGARVTEGR
jgi:anti-sigma regulatory factor (Ser/Thr protein kinase)